MKNEYIFSAQETKTEKERKKIIFCGGENTEKENIWRLGEKKYCFRGEEKEVKIFGEGKYFLRRRKKTEKEKEENIWRSKILFLHRE